MRNRKSGGDMALWIAGIVFFLTFCLSGGMLLNYYIEGWKQAALNEKLAELKHPKTADYVIVEAEPLGESANTQGAGAQNNMQNQGVLAGMTENDAQTGIAKNAAQTAVSSLSQINSDYVTWIQVTDTKIDYPVVQRDNSYYLKHDFYGEKNSRGTIFLDEACGVEDKFLLIHGHRMKDGTMFGALKEYKKAEFRENHREIVLSWDDKEERYEIFAAALIDLQEADYFHYQNMPTTEEEEKAYLEQLKEVAFWYEENEWQVDNRYVILSTCDYGAQQQRLIIVARRTDVK